MTRDEFIADLGQSEFLLREAGLAVVECACGDPNCDGWTTVSAIVAEGLEDE